MEAISRAQSAQKSRTRRPAECLLVRGPDHRLLHADAATQELFDRPLEDLVGLPPFGLCSVVFLSDGTLARERELPLVRATRFGQPLSGLGIIRLPGGGIIWTYSTVTPIYKLGAVVRFCRLNLEWTPNETLLPLAPDTRRVY